MTLNRRAMFTNGFLSILGVVAAKLGFKAAPQRISGRVWTFGVYKPEQADFSKVPAHGTILSIRDEDGIWHEIKGVTDIGNPWSTHD
jgi:hypothetical protein